MQKREKPSQREVYRCDDCYTLDGLKTVELAKAKVGSSEHRRWNNCAKHVVLQARLPLPPRESLARETTERGEDGK